MTSFELSPELGPVLAKYLDQRSPVESSRTGGHDLPALWRGLVDEIGVVGLVVEEGLGGQGAGLTELGAAVYQAGAHGWSGPLVATAGVAVRLLGSTDPTDASGLLGAIAGEGRVVVVAFHEHASGADLTSTAELVEGRLVARREVVDSGTHADTVLLLARESGVPVLVAVDAAGPDVVLTPRDGVDVGRGMASMEWLHARAEVVARGEHLPAALHDAWLVGALLTAVDAVGAAGRAFELAREYATTREQFGRSIGSFQSVKHRLVDMYAELETARSAVREALRQADDRQSERWRFVASAAAARAGDATMYVVREAVQVHGGIGFTWEHEVSHHFRRVTALRALYGTPTQHRSLVAAECGL